MNGLNGFSLSYLKHQSKIFWVLFILLGILLISGSLGSVFYLDILLGFLVVIIGIEKLREEIYSHVNEREKKTVYESINYINNWMESTQDLTNLMKDKYNNRLFSLNNRQNELNRNLELKYRELVRKIIEVENKLNETNKILKILAKEYKTTKIKRPTKKKKM